jgi:hypothetical protein
MQSDKAPVTEKDVVETSVQPAFPRISNQPDRYGALSEAFLFFEEKRLYEVGGKLKGYIGLALFVLAIPIVANTAYHIMTNRLEGTVMDIAKIILIYVLTGGLGALIGLWIYRHKIMELLAQLEDLAYFGDDMARFYMPYARSELKDLNERLNKHKQDPTIPSTFEVARDVWPVISMILKRDPNIIKWGTVGLKVYKTLSAFFKGNNTSEPTA